MLSRRDSGTWSETLVLGAVAAVLYVLGRIQGRLGESWRRDEIRRAEEGRRSDPIRAEELERVERDDAERRRLLGGEDEEAGR